MKLLRKRAQKVKKKKNTKHKKFGVVKNTFLNDVNIKEITNKC